MPERRTVLWSRPALDDLREIRNYVSRDKPEAAKRLAQRIRTKVLWLAEHPKSGRVVPEYPTQAYREVIVPPYRVVYLVQEARVIILRVWHGRRERV